MYREVLLFLPLFLFVLHCNGVVKENDKNEDWYKKVIKSNIIPPYIKAYKIFQEKILNKLINFNNDELLLLSESEDNETIIEKFVQQLHCNVKQFNEQLEKTVNISQRTIKEVEKKIIPIQKLIEKQKRDIRKIHLMKTQLDLSIEDITKDINMTENSIKQKEKELENAEKDVKDAEKRLENAKLCRNKRFLGSWDPVGAVKRVGNQISKGLDNVAGQISDGYSHLYTELEDGVKHVGGQISDSLDDIGEQISTGTDDVGDQISDGYSHHYTKIEDSVKNHIIKPLCSEINHGGINNARYIRDEALNSLNNARDQLKSDKNRLDRLQQRKKFYENDLIRANNYTKILQTEINELYLDLNITTNINYQLKIAFKHLTTLFTRTIDLKDEIKYLIEFQLLIEPLNNVYNELKNNNLISQTIDNQLVLITNDQLKNIENSLKKLIDILPNIPMNTSLNKINDDDSDCD